MPKFQSGLTDEQRRIVHDFVESTFIRFEKGHLDFEIALKNFETALSNFDAGDHTAVMEFMQAVTTENRLDKDE